MLKPVTLLVVQLLLLISPVTLYAGEHADISLLADASTLKAATPIHLLVRVKLAPGWHTYWKNAGDSGIAPDLKWVLPRGFTISDTQFLAPERLVTGDLVDYGYNGEADYLATLTPPDALSENTTAIIALHASVLVCKDICIPEKAELSLALPVGENKELQPTADEALVAHLWSELPQPMAELSYTLKGEQITFAMPVEQTLPSNIQDAAFFPEEDNFITNSTQQQVRVDKNKVTFVLHKAGNTVPDNVHGVVSLYLKSGERKNYALTLTNDTLQTVNKNIMILSNSGILPTLLAILFAFVGGIILNAMPCVFPILSIKALAIARQAAHHPSVVRKQGFAYASGVVVSFLVLAGVLVILQSGGRAVGWGYQMQSPPFVLFLTLLLAGVGFNLSGLYEFPSLNFAGGPTSQEGLVGGFLSGILAVLVATPCTAPFMAPAIGYAFAQPLIVIFIVFTSLGLGLASPFLLLSLFPRLTSKLPRPGVWMLTLRQALAFPMYLAAIWLYWVFMREAGADASALVLVAIVFLACALWIGQHLPTYFITRIVIWIVAAVALAGACIITMQPAETVSAAFSMERLEALRAEGKPVLVDATADWCITCKVNEHLVLKSPSVTALFAKHGVVVMVADWTHGAMDITRYLAMFNRRGVPLYVYYAPHKEPVVLPQILSDSTLKETVEP